MAAAALLRSVATKMSRAAAPTHHRSLVARGLHLHGGAGLGPPTDVIQQGTADVLVSAGMAAATGLRSVAGRLTTKMAHAPPPHRLLHGRGLHGRTFPDPIPSTPPKGPQTHDKKVGSGSDWDRAKIAAIEATSTCVSLTVAFIVLYMAGLIRL